MISSGTRISISIVEPDSGFASELRQEFEGNNWQVTVHESTYQVINYLLLKRPLPDVVVSNLNLPDVPATILYDCVQNAIFLAELLFLFYVRTGDEVIELTRHRPEFRNYDIVISPFTPQIVTYRVKQLLNLQLTEEVSNRAYLESI